VDQDFWAAFAPQTDEATSAKTTESSTTTTSSPNLVGQHVMTTPHARFLKLTLYITQLALATTGVVCYGNGQAKLDTCERGINLLEILLDNVGGEQQLYGSFFSLVLILCYWFLSFFLYSLFIFSFERKENCVAFIFSFDSFRFLSGPPLTL
jgi:hypothetical protein